MECCSNDLRLKPHNQDIDIGLDAEQSGEYNFLLNFNGAKINKIVTFEMGDALIIPKPFNEDYLYSFQIIQPDTTLLEFNDCENFQFQTYVSVQPCDQGNCEIEETETYS